MKEMKLENGFDFETFEYKGWTHRDEFLEKHIGDNTITIEENQDTHDFNVYVTHHTDLKKSSFHNKTFKLRCNLTKEKIAYLGTNIETVVEEENNLTKITVELYRLPVIIYPCTFKEKLDMFEKYVNLL